MRYGGLPTEVSGDVEPETGAPPQPPSEPSRLWRRRVVVILGVVGAIAVGALVWTTVHNSSKPAVSKADVGKIVDNKVGTAVNNLKNEPPPGVGIYSTVRPELVVIESDGIGHSHDA